MVYMTSQKGNALIQALLPLYTNQPTLPLRRWYHQISADHGVECLRSAAVTMSDDGIDMATFLALLLALID